MMLDISEVSEYIRSQPESSRIYIGGDSHRFKKNDRWYAEYTVVVVVHKEGNKGCKIFGQSDIQPDYDAVIHKPRMRLMNEVYKVADLYMAIQKVIDQRPVEIHLDINPDKAHGSSVVVQQAIGYIKGLCNIIPMTKPKAFAASCAADRMKTLPNVVSRVAKVG